MNKSMVKLNNEVNKLLQSSLMLEESLGLNGREDLASFVRATTSRQATEMIRATGLQEALREFWNDKKV